MRRKLLHSAEAAAIAFVLAAIAINFFYPGDLKCSLVAGAGSAAFAAQWTSVSRM